MLKCIKKVVLLFGAITISVEVQGQTSYTYSSDPSLGSYVERTSNVVNWIGGVIQQKVVSISATEVTFGISKRDGSSFGNGTFAININENVNYNEPAFGFSKSILSSQNLKYFEITVSQYFNLSQNKSHWVGAFNSSNGLTYYSGSSAINRTSVVQNAFYIRPSRSSFNFDEFGSITTISISTNINPNYLSISTSDGWLMYQYTEVGLTLTASQNTGVARSATVTISGGGISTIVTITQNAATVITPTPVQCNDNAISFVDNNRNRILNNGIDLRLTITEAEKIVVEICGGKNTNYYQKWHKLLLNSLIKSEGWCFGLCQVNKMLFNNNSLINDFGVNFTYASELNSNNYAFSQFVARNQLMGFFIKDKILTNIEVLNFYNDAINARKASTIGFWWIDPQSDSVVGHALNVVGLNTCSGGGKLIVADPNTLNEIDTLKLIGNNSYSYINKNIRGFKVGDGYFKPSYLSCYNTDNIAETIQESFDFDNKNSKLETTNQILVSGAMVRNEDIISTYQTYQMPSIMNVKAGAMITIAGLDSAIVSNDFINTSFVIKNKSVLMKTVILNETGYVDSEFVISNLNEKMEDKASVSIYPNPSKGNFTVSNAKSVTVFDIFGKIVLTTSETAFEIPIKGLYVARFETDNGDFKFVKLVVE
ncbi:MAG: T9SS C-terminal target domain-containing protein [Cytophagales bacterium]|nr:MAG: T9SS C-terminal target domain-containing protein [Cytophagales bacterium]